MDINNMLFLVFNTVTDESYYILFLNGLKTTLILTIASFLLGSVLGAGLCAIRCSRYKRLVKVVDSLNKFFVELPTVVLLMIFVYVIFGSSGLSVLLITIFALTLKAASYISDIFYTGINTVSIGEIEAARTLGMSRSKTFFKVTLPQTLKAALPVYQNQFISTMQETSIVGYIAVMDVTRASEVVTSRTLNAIFGLIIISVIYLVLGYLGQKLLGLLNRNKHITSLEGLIEGGSTA